MSNFKQGDKVTPVSSERRGYNGTMKQLVGKTLLVHSVGNDETGNETVCAGVPGEFGWYWYSDDLQLVTERSAEQFQAEANYTAQKPLRRGDLVMWSGEIGVVYGIDPDGECWVASLAGDDCCVCRGAEDLTRVGSIRKKVKRLKAQMGGEK